MISALVPMLSVLLLALDAPVAQPAPAAGVLTITSAFGEVGERTVTIQPDGSVLRARTSTGLYQIADCPEKGAPAQRADYQRLSAFVKSAGSQRLWPPAEYTGKGAYTPDGDNRMFYVRLYYAAGAPSAYEALGIDDKAPRELVEMVRLFEQTMKGCLLLQGSSEEGIPITVKWYVNYRHGGLGGGSDLEVDSEGRARYQESFSHARPSIPHKMLSPEMVAMLGDAITPLLNGAVSDGLNSVLDCTYFLTLERHDHTSETTSRSLELPCMREDWSPQTRKLTDLLDAVRIGAGDPQGVAQNGPPGDQQRRKARRGEIKRAERDAKSRSR